jgi:sRNA-binding carbon storage regulator CsrA
MKTSLKAPRKGAVARMREIYNKIRNQPVTPEHREELREVFKKKDRAAKSKKPKKIAKPMHDAELP